MKNKFRPLDILIRLLIILSALVTASILLLILGYILINGLPNISWDFITDIYRPSDDQFGILPMIINTLYMVVLTLLIAVPVGVSTAICLTEYAKQGRFVAIVRFTSEILSGIPSIIYGLFGFMFFVLICNLQYSIIAGALTLSIMVLPTILRTTEEALKSVPYTYREGALALGATRFRIIFTILLPNAMPGIVTSVVLAMGRIVGESAALIFTAGIVYKMPKDVLSHIFSSGRTLTLHLYQLAALGEPLKQSFATAAVLLIIVLILNFLARRVASALKKS